MQAVDLSFGEAVALEWMDSKSLLGWVYSPQQLGELKSIKSLGFVVSSSSKALAITSSINVQNAVIDPLLIPWPCVERLQKIGPDWDR